MYRCLTSNGPGSYAVAMQGQHFCPHVQNLKGGKKNHAFLVAEGGGEEQISKIKIRKINLQGCVLGVRRESNGEMIVNQNFIRMEPL